MGVTHGPGNMSSSVALSPDGATLVLAGTDDSGQRLYRRSLDRLAPTPVRGTEGGSSPFFSPEGDWIGFVAERRLKRVPAEGGAAVEIASLPGFLVGASWGADGRIVFAAGGRSPLFVVSDDSGQPERLTVPESEADEGGPSDANDRQASRVLAGRHPELLPDGRTLLFDSSGWVHTVDLESGRRAKIVRGRQPRYASSGHLVVSRDSGLFVVPFDSSRLEVTGTVVPVIEGIVERYAGLRHYGISRTGTLAHVSAAGAYELVLRETDGSERLMTETRTSFQNPQFSPDGRRVAVATRRRAGDPLDIWIHDLDTGTASRLTFGGGNRAPVWTPDGTEVTFSHLGPQQGIYAKSADGRGDAERLVAVDEFHWLIGWTPERGILAYGVMEGGDTDDGTSPSSFVALTNGESRRVVRPARDRPGREVTVVLNWLTELGREAEE